MIIFGARMFRDKNEKIPRTEWTYVAMTPEMFLKDPMARALCEMVFMRFDESAHEASWSLASATSWGLENARDEVVVVAFDGGAIDVERRVRATFVFETPEANDRRIVMRVACLDVV
ncbi:MAG: hypothetical protein CMI16_06920 [Opitutaceae bacterium]|nr:hypothetical protein [Opitutaceae bacterium]